MYRWIKRIKNKKDNSKNNSEGNENDLIVSVMKKVKCWIGYLLLLLLIWILDLVFIK